MRILMGMSGGLDSTYAAHLLLEQGHQVEGLLLKMSCFTDVEPAQEAADALGIKLNVADANDLFEEYVVNNFVSEYCNARTPNPCIMCNRYVKFQLLCDYAEKNGFDLAATGHYASVLEENGRYFIRRSSNQKKDQSYVLWQLTQKQLSSLILPLAKEDKDVIRENARVLGFKSADAKESQEICFIPDNDYVNFITNKTGKRFPEGNFVDTNGKVVGRHKGIVYYTVGQRKGLNIALGKPMFVTSIDPEKNTVTIGEAGSELSNSLVIKKINFQKLAPKETKLRAMVKIRYAAIPVEAEVTIEQDKDCDSSSEPSYSAFVEFDSPVRAITPGQSAVAYDGDDLLFGGFIE